MGTPMNRNNARACSQAVIATIYNIEWGTGGCPDSPRGDCSAAGKEPALPVGPGIATGETSFSRTLPDHHAGVAYDSVAVAGDVARGCVFHQLRRGCAEFLRSREHDDCRAEAAHADVLLRDRIVERVGVEGEDGFNRTVVFHAGDGVGFVMIHVARGYDQNWIVLRRDHLRNGFAQLLESLELMSAERDGNELELGLAHL